MKCSPLATRSLFVVPAFHVERSVKHLRRALPLALGLLSLAMISPAFAQEEEMRRVLTVTGQGSEAIPTALSQVTLGVEVQGNTAEEVQQEVAQRSTAIVELLQSRNVSRLQTAGLYLSPIYDYNDSTPRITGYTATNTVSFRITTEQAGTLIDEAIRAGATRVDGISFVADDATIATAQQEAIREAIEDAQSQADAAFGALGFTAGEIVNVQINGGSYIPPIPYYGGGVRAAEAAASTPIIGGEQEVQASVTLQISY